MDWQFVVMAVLLNRIGPHTYHQMASDYLLGFCSRERGRDGFDLNSRLEPDIYIIQDGTFICNEEQMKQPKH